MDLHCSGALRHLKQHRGEFDHSCDVCGKKFTIKALFNLHQKVHAEKHLKLETCQICSKTLSDISGLWAHMLSKQSSPVHSDARPFTCNFCSKPFKDKTTMKNNLDNIHIDTKKFNCNLGEKGFITLGQFKRQEGLLPGYKPFFCSYWQKIFHSKMLHEGTCKKM